MTKKYVNGELVDLTTEEENQIQTDISNATTEIQQAQIAKENYENLKASAKAKLVAGEALTQEEADTIVL